MRWPKWNRKQKIRRNSALCLLLFLLLEWSMGFPVWSREALLRRAEGIYLLENTSRILHDGEGWHGGPALYAENDGRILAVSYSRTPLGLRLGYVEYCSPEARYIMECSWVDKEKEAYVVCLETQVVGFLENVHRAELDVTLTEYAENSTASQAVKTSVVSLEGEKVGDCCIQFPRTIEEDFDAWRTDVGPVVLRMYDESGALLEVRRYTIGYFSRTTSEEGEPYEN